MRTNAHLKQAADAEIEGTRGGARVGEGLAVELASEVSVRVDLHHGQPTEIAFQRWMIAQRRKQRREDTVFPSEGHRKHVPSAPWSKEGFHVVELLEERPSLRGPRLFGPEREACGQVLAKHDLVHFDLGAGLQARHWTLRRALAVGGGQFVREREDDDVRCNRAVLGQTEEGGRAIVHGPRAWLLVKSVRPRGLPATKGRFPEEG